MTALKIIEIYQTNPYEKGQGGGVRYVSNLFKIFSKTGQSVEFWGTGNKKDNQLNFFNIGGKNNYLIFWLRFINRFIFTRFPTPTILHCHRIYFAASLEILKKVFMKNKASIWVTIHAESFSNLANRCPDIIWLLLKPIVYSFEYICFLLLKNIVFVSEENKNFYILRHPSLEKKLKLRPVFSSMLDLELSKRDLKIPRKNKRLVMIGRLADVKDYPFVISLVDKYKNDFLALNITIDIFGDGEDKLAISNSIKEKQLEKIIFLRGEVENDKVPNILHNAYGLLLTSKNEAAPTVILEGLSQACPIITANVGFAKKLVEQASCGFVVDKNYSDFFEAIKMIDTVIPDYTEIEKILYDRKPEIISKGYIKEFKKCL